MKQYILTFNFFRASIDSFTSVFIELTRNTKIAIVTLVIARSLKLGCWAPRYYQILSILGLKILNPKVQFVFMNPYIELFIISVNAHEHIDRNSVNNNDVNFFRMQ